MSLKSSKVKERVVTIKPTFEGEPVEIRYKPSSQTLKEARAFEKQLSSANDEEKIDLLAKWICDTVAFIDWTDDDGQLVPLTVERLMDEPAEILTFILKSVTDHIAETQKK
jgi:hypothetical protein